MRKLALTVSAFLLFPVVLLAGKNLADYPLQIRVVESHWHRHRDGTVDGWGRGDIKDGDSVHGFDFRLGLIPLKTPKKFSDKEEVLFSLSEEGPKTVYSKDMKSSGDVEVANPNIPIMKLAQGQNLKVDAKAVLGVGTRSAKFSTCLASYSANESGTEFEFYVEAFGQIPAPEIFSRALDIITSNVKEIHKELKK